MHTLRSLLSLAVAASCIPGLLLTPGCEKKAAPTPAKPGAPATGGESHGHEHGHGDEHGPVTQLGEQTGDGYTIKASRDGAVTPGGEAPIDVSVTGGAAKVTAVRCWIGAQDAKGSVKAKAESEKDSWHAHVEIPKPLPAGSRLWVEVEPEKGNKVVVGFDLKS